jgi:TPR repeat protein
MRTAVLTVALLASMAMASIAAPALTGWRRLLPTVSGNLAITKERAERGDVRSQVELADNLAANLLVAQAVEWYQKAAAQGNAQAMFRLGEIYLGGVTTPNDPDQRVAANVMEGVRWTFEAATNYHSEACHNMSLILQTGVGLNTNLVEAYAWLELYARSNAVAARPEMDRLAMHMDLKEIQESHLMAGQFMSHQWPRLCLRKYSDADLALKINGITVGPVSMAIINGRTFEEGDSGEVPARDGPARITCLKVALDSVLIAVDGETEPRLLHMK